LELVLLEKEKGLRLEIPDWAFDMHTARGVRKGRGKKTKKGWEFFYNVSTKLENESLPNPYTKRLKELRGVSKKPISEEEIGITTRKCAFCGNDFNMRDKRVKYCSSSCSKSALKKQILNAVHKFRATQISCVTNANTFLEPFSTRPTKVNNHVNKK
jgi:hypothetical protein